jgi:ankyrin repeat protein
MKQKGGCYNCFLEFICVTILIIMATNKDIWEILLCSFITCEEDVVQIMKNKLSKHDLYLLKIIIYSPFSGNIFTDTFIENIKKKIFPIDYRHTEEKIQKNEHFIDLIQYILENHELYYQYNIFRTDSSIRFENYTDSHCLMLIKLVELNNGFILQDCFFEYLFKNYKDELIIELSIKAPCNKYLNEILRKITIYMCENDRVHILRKIIENNNYDKFRTLWEILCSRIHDPIVCKMFIRQYKKIKKNNIFVNYIDRQLIFDAIYYDRVDIVKLMIERCDIDLEYIDNQGCGYLVRAAYCGSDKLVNIFLDKGCDPNLGQHCQSDLVRIDNIGTHKWNAIHFAASNKKINMLSHFLDNPKTDVNLQNNYNETPLIIACKNRNTDTANYLLDHNCDVDKVDNYGYDAMAICIESKNINLIIRIIDSKRISLDRFFDLSASTMLPIECFEIVRDTTKNLRVLKKAFSEGNIGKIKILNEKDQKEFNEFIEKNKKNPSENDESKISEKLELEHVDKKNENYVVNFRECDKKQKKSCNCILI